jgi:hypothetical protein
VKGVAVGSYLLVQISDVHLTAGESLPPGVWPRDNLLSGLRLLAKAGLRPDVFLLTGDLADAGDGACYDDLVAILADAADASGATVVYLPGNHDDRSTFRRHMLDGANDSGTDGPLNQTHWRDGLRIIAPGFHDPRRRPRRPRRSDARLPEVRADQARPRRDRAGAAPPADSVANPVHCPARPA